MSVSEPNPNDKIWDNITFNGRGNNYKSHLQNYSQCKNMYIFNEYFFFLALRDYIHRQDSGLWDTQLTNAQLKHILDSFSSAPTGSFLRELHEIYTSFESNPMPPQFFNSVRELFKTLCYNIQQDGMHDFYELGRVLVANFKTLVKTYINHGDEVKFVHLKEEHFDKLGLPKLEKFTLDQHEDGKYFIDTLSTQHKELFEFVYKVPIDQRKNPPWYNSPDHNINRITTSVAATLDGTGSVKKTDRCILLDNVSLKKKWNSGQIELGIYSFGAIVLSSMYDLVCYVSKNDATYKHMFYPFFKFDGDDDKSVLFRTKSVLMVLVRYDPQNHTSDHEEILVDNRTFTVANISKDIYKVYNTINKEQEQKNNDSVVWFNKLKTDNLFMGILKLCVPTNTRKKIIAALENPSAAPYPKWRDVKHYIKNARNLYTKFKIFGKGLGDFNQAYEEVVLNNLNNYREGKFVFNNLNKMKKPDIPTTPLALLTIDRNLAVVCANINADVLLSSPGYYSINPDAVYRDNDTLQKIHNAFNSVPILIVRNSAVLEAEKKLIISMSDADSTQNLPPIDLRNWIIQPTGASPQNVELLEGINNNNSALKIEINYDDSGLVTATRISIETHRAANSRRVYAGELSDAFENMGVTLKTKLKELVGNNRFFICYYPPASGTAAYFKFKHLYCGTFKAVLSEPINDIMYKPVEGDIYAVASDRAAATIPYDPEEEFFKNIKDDKSYWSDDGDWRRVVRELRLEMKREFDSNTKLDKCHEAFLNYLPFDLVYPFKSETLNDEIKNKCNTEVPVDTLEIHIKDRRTYFEEPYEYHKTTPSYLNLVDLIKSGHSVSLRESSFAKCLNDLFLIPNGGLQLNVTDSLTLDQLIECMDLLTTPTATRDTILSIAAHPKPKSSFREPEKIQSYQDMMENFRKLLYDMSQNFQRIFNRDILVHFFPHNKIYTALKSEIETLHKILLTQYEDVKKLISLYSSIPNDDYAFYRDTKSVYKHLIKTKGFNVLTKLIEMLIKVKRRYFNLLSIIECDNTGVFDKLIKDLIKELNGLDDNDQAPVTAAASREDDEAKQDGNISSTYVQAANLTPDEINKIDAAKNAMLKLYDPDIAPDEKSLQENLDRDIANAKREKERCEVFMRINEELDKLYTKCVNSAYSIAAMCLKGQQQPVNKTNKSPIYKLLTNFRAQVQSLFYNHPLSNIVKFHKEFNLLLELENLVFILYEEVKELLQDDSVEEKTPADLIAASSGTSASDEIDTSGGGNIGNKYKKNKKKRKSYMKGGFIAKESFNELEYAIEKRMTFLNEYIVDNLYEEDLKKSNLSLMGVDEMQVDSTNASPLSQTHFSPELSPLPPDTLTRSPSASHSRTYSASSQETLPRDNIYEMLPPRKRQKIKGGRKPKAEAKKPKAESKIAKAESKIAKTEAKKPKAESKIAKAEAKKPKAESKKPKAEAKKPKAESKIAKTEAKKPKAEVKKPKADANKPKAEAKKPKADAKKPKAEAEPKRALLLKFKF